MSRTGWSTANFMRYGGSITGMPLTIAAWGYTTTIAGVGHMMVGLFQGTATGSSDSITLSLSGTAVVADCTGGSGGGQAITSTPPPTNTWFHACGVYTSTTSRAAYINGGSKGTDTTSTTTPFPSRTSIGKRDNASNDRAFGAGGTGYLADVAIWNVALTDAEVLSLSKGFSPLLVRPSALVFYSPLYGVGSSEPNLINSAAEATINGTLTQGFHPPIIMPRRPLITR